MSAKLAAAVLVAAVVTSGPALACMGNTVLFSDNFQQADPAWTLDTSSGTLAISGGYAQLTPKAGDWAEVDYEGAFFDSADACIDTVTPAVGDPTKLTAALMFGQDQSGNFWQFVIEADGWAAVERYSVAGNGAWLNPVAWKQTSLVKTGANAVNTLRVTWNGNSGTAYINGQQFTTFVIPQVFQNTTFGFFASGDTGVAGATTAATWKFANVKVTNVPSP